MPTTLIYLHGFMSSPLSEKARETLDYVQRHRPDIQVRVPKLPNKPGEAVVTLDQLAADYAHQKVGVVGSSLGGYFTHYLANKLGCHGVLVNPAVKPYDLLQHYLGPQTNPYTNERFTLVPDDMSELRKAEVIDLPHPEHYWVLLQTGDETLDYRQAADKYAAAKLTIEQGGNHRFANYQQYLPEIINFLF